MPLQFKPSLSNTDLNAIKDHTKVLVLCLNNKNKNPDSSTKLPKEITNTLKSFSKQNNLSEKSKFHLIHPSLENKTAILLISGLVDTKKNTLSPKLKPLYEQDLYQNLKAGLNHLKNNYSNKHTFFVHLLDLIECFETKFGTKDSAEQKKLAYDHLTALSQVEHEINYEFKKFKGSDKKIKSNNKKLDICAVSSEVLSKHNAFIKKSTSNYNSINDAIHFCKNLANTPPNVCNPVFLAKTAKDLSKSHKSIKTKVLDEAALKKMGMNCLVAVGQASETTSKLIECQYTHPSCKADKPIILVGKGITFDTGGLSLKAPKSMVGMHLDMCGSASVLAALKGCAELELKVNLVVLVPTAENSADSKSYRPNDIIKSYDGQTVEILNTDAEGRVILCDALTYADKKHSPKAMVDLATLTGAIIIALGHDYTGLFSNNDTLANKLLDCGVNSQDLAWHMPLHPDYKRSLKSNFADMTNCGDHAAGSMTAAQYLASFVGKCKNWAHLDIAGTAMNKTGGSGRAVRLLLQYLSDQQKA